VTVTMIQVSVLSKILPHVANYTDARSLITKVIGKYIGAVNC